MEKNLLIILIGLLVITLISSGMKPISGLSPFDSASRDSLNDLGTGDPRGVNLSNYTDLIVSNISVSVNSLQNRITVLTYIRNLGNGIATDSTTQLRFGTMGTEERLPTPFIRPGQTVLLNAVEYSAPRGSSITITATADYLNNVIESNEYNNVATRTVIVP